MRKLLRLSVLALAAMFANGAYAQLPEEVGLGEADNILKQQGITSDNAAEHFWLNQVSDDNYAGLLDGNLADHCIQSNWEAYVEPNYLYVYLNEKVGGPMIAYIQRWSNKANNHVTVMTVFGTNEESAKKEVTNKGWDEIATVNVSNPGSDKSGLTDLFFPSKPYKYFRFRTDATDHPTRWWSFHMGEFGLYSVPEDKVGALKLKAADANWAGYLQTPLNLGDNYYQYSDKESWAKFIEAETKINKYVEAGTEVSEKEADAMIAEAQGYWDAVQNSYVLFQVPEAGYYRMEFVNKPGYYVAANWLYGMIFVGKDDKADARQLWYMEPAGTGVTLVLNAADGSFPQQQAGSHIMSFTPRIFERYFHGDKEIAASEFGNATCSIDAFNKKDANGNDIVGLRPASAMRYVDSNLTDDWGSYAGFNKKEDALTNTDDFYLSKTAKWTEEAAELRVVRVPDAEAKEIIAKSSYYQYQQLQETIESANDLLDIAADAENCFSTALGQEYTKAGCISSAEGEVPYANDMLDNNNTGTYGHDFDQGAHFLPRGAASMNIDLGTKVEGGVNVFIQFADNQSGYSFNPVEWRVYGTNDEGALKLASNSDMAGWDLLDPCFNGSFDGSVNCNTLPLNLGKGYRYLRFVCWLSWSLDNWQWYRNQWRLGTFRIFKAERKSASQIEGDNAQALLAAVKAAIAVAPEKATAEDVKALQTAIESFKLGFADPTALRQLLAQTSLLAKGATEEFVGEDAGLFIEPMDAEFGAAWAEANEYANSGVYTQEQLEYYFESLSSLKGDVENAAVMPDASKWYFLSFASEDLYEEYDWSKASCWEDGGNSLFDNMLSAESADEGAKFFYSTDYDESEDMLSNFRFEQNGDTYAIVNGCGKYLSLLSGLPRLSEKATYYSVIPVGYGQFIFKAEGVVLNGELSNLTLDTAADGNCNTNAAFQLVDTGEEYDAIKSIKDNKQKSNAIYSIDGKQVNDNFKGVVIKNGSKILNK